MSDVNLVPLPTAGWVERRILDEDDYRTRVSSARVRGGTHLARAWPGAVCHTCDDWVQLDEARVVWCPPTDTFHHEGCRTRR